MEPAEAQQIIRMVESNWQFDLGQDGREVWRYELVNHDAALATRAVARMAKYPLPNGRSRPQLSDLRSVILALARDAAKPPALPVSPMRRPDWVLRWRRARDAGDQRPFPEQAQGYEALRRLHPLNVVAYELPHIAHTSREHWVQQDEYTEQLEVA